jgi:FkbM family methyltransferase
VVSTRMFSRARRTLGARLRAARFLRAFPPPTPADVLTIGDPDYGGYQVPQGLLGPDSVVVSAGAGTDVSFESMLVSRFGCRIHLLDPVPESREYVVEALGHEPRITYECAALWSEETELRFHAPEIVGHVSHSATDLHHTPPVFTAPARTLRSLRAQHRWDRIDLLKISAEGAEFEILAAVLADDEPVSAICVEFAQPVRVAAVTEAIDRLAAADYRLLARSVRPFNWKLTFVRADRSV